MPDKVAGLLLTLPDYKHTCPRYTTGDINSQCFACAYEGGAKAQLAKALKHRLDRPELRKKIDSILSQAIMVNDRCEEITKTDQILALIPDIEEARSRREKSPSRKWGNILPNE